MKVPLIGTTIGGSDLGWALSHQHAGMSFDYFSERGFSIFRQGFYWNTLYPNDLKTSDPTYLDNLMSYVTTALSYGAKVVVDCHSNSFWQGAGIDEDSTDPKVPHLSDFIAMWMTVASRPEIKNNDEVFLGISNEPHVSGWNLLHNKVVAALRAAGITNPITCAVNNGGWAIDGTNYFTDPLNKTYMEVHQYWDNAGGSAGIKAIDIAGGPPSMIRGQTLACRGYASFKPMYPGEVGFDTGTLSVSLLPCYMIELNRARDAYYASNFWASGAEFDAYIYTFNQNHSTLIDRDNMRAAQPEILAPSAKLVTKHHMVSAIPPTQDKTSMVSTGFEVRKRKTRDTAPNGTATSVYQYVDLGTPIAVGSLSNLNFVTDTGPYSTDTSYCSTMCADVTNQGLSTHNPDLFPTPRGGCVEFWMRIKNATTCSTGYFCGAHSSVEGNSWRDATSGALIFNLATKGNGIVYTSPTDKTPDWMLDDKWFHVRVGFGVGGFYIAINGTIMVSNTNSYDNAVMPGTGFMLGGSSGKAYSSPPYDYAHFAIWNTPPTYEDFTPPTQSYLTSRPDGLLMYAPLVNNDTNLYYMDDLSPTPGEVVIGTLTPTTTTIAVPITPSDDVAMHYDIECAPDGVSYLRYGSGLAPAGSQTVLTATNVPVGTDYSLRVTAVTVDGRKHHGTPVSVSTGKQLWTAPSLSTPLTTPNSIGFYLYPSNNATLGSITSYVVGISKTQGSASTSTPVYNAIDTGNLYFTKDSSGSVITPGTYYVAVGCVNSAGTTWSAETTVVVSSTDPHYYTVRGTTPYWTTPFNAKFLGTTGLIEQRVFINVNTMNVSDYWGNTVLGNLTMDYSHKKDNSRYGQASYGIEFGGISNNTLSFGVVATSDANKSIENWFGISLASIPHTGIWLKTLSAVSTGSVEDAAGNTYSSGTVSAFYSTDGSNWTLISTATGGPTGLNQSASDPIVVGTGGNVGLTIHTYQAFDTNIPLYSCDFRTQPSGTMSFTDAEGNVWSAVNKAPVL